MKDYVKLTMTGPAGAMEEAQSLEELRNSHVAVLVARHFEAMWIHMRQGLGALPVPHHRLMHQVCPAACGQDNVPIWTPSFCLSILMQLYAQDCRCHAQALPTITEGAANMNRFLSQSQSFGHQFA